MTDLRDRLQTTLGDSYSIDRELGGGGMSRVFVAHETALGRQVVLKVLPAELAAGVSAERFAREVRLAANLQHPCIVPVLSSGATGEVPYYTMPLIEGDSLRARMSRGRIPLPEAVKILRDIASAMTYAHEHGIVHRDIKPENVLLSQGYAVVTDFGIAKAVEGSRTMPGFGGGTLTQLGSAIGTPAYMAPEQAAGDTTTDHRADIYAWGMLAYEVLAGAHAFAGKTSPSALLAAQMAETPVALNKAHPALPPALSSLVMRAVAKDPAQRPQTAAELVAALDAVGTGEHTSMPKMRGIPRIALAAAGIIVLIGGIIGVPRLLRGRATAGDASVAVLPFTIIGGDTADVYFGDGMAEELTSALAKVEGLRVASRSAAAAMRGKDPKSVHDALGVANVLEGTIRRANGTLRIGAQLTDATNGTVLWTDSFDRPAANVFAVQDEIAGAIVSALRTRLGSTAATGPIAVSGTRDVQAHEDYLRGVYLFTQRGSENMLNARERLVRATERDPRFADAWSALAMVYTALPDWSGFRRDSSSILGKAAAKRALALDPSQARAHAALGGIFDEEDPTEALKQLQLAVQLDSSNAAGLHWLGLEYGARGQLAKAIDLLKRAHRADPLAPHIHYTLAAMQTTNGQIDDARAELDQLLSVNRTYSSGLIARAQVAILQHDTALAVRLVDSAKVDETPLEKGGVALFARGWAGSVRFNSGNRDYDRDMLPKLRAFEPRDQSGWAAYAESVIWADMGQRDSLYATMNRSLKLSPGRARFFSFSLPHKPFMHDAQWVQAYKAVGLDWAP